MGGHFDANPFGPLHGADIPHSVRYWMTRGFVKPGETVLDAGCGTGYGSYLLAEYAHRVIAVDAEPTFSPRWEHDRIDFRVLDLGKDELPDADITICIEVAEHINGLEHFVQQVHQHTKRMIIICAPLGGTSHIYTKEQLELPEGENNDFNNIGHLESTFYHPDWRPLSTWEFGYSGIVVLLKDEK